MPTTCTYCGFVWDDPEDEEVECICGDCADRIEMFKDDDGDPGKSVESPTPKS